MKIAVIGGGFVGVTTAVVLGEQGHDVHLVEVDAHRREALAIGQLPFYEPGLAEAWQACAVPVLASISLLSDVELAFLCVGTPSSPDGGADLQFVAAAASELVGVIGDGTIVVKSTVPPGTTEQVIGPLGVSYAMNPEFLREGCALQDARSPDRVVVGVADEQARERLLLLYSDLECPVMVTDVTTAEMVKYASNSMLATRVAFANEMGNLCQRIGVNVDEVMSMVGLDFRIGPHFLKAGVGFGGSCFPKDVKALRATARMLGVDVGILDAVLAQNDQQPLVAVRLLEEALGSLSGKRVALLGLAFKPDTSDVRETRALPIYEALVEAGASVICYDPKAGPEFAHLVDGVKAVSSSEEALTGADGCIIQTEWPEFLEIPVSSFPPVVVDGRRHLDRAALEEAGVRYIGVGDGRANHIKRELVS